MTAQEKQECLLDFWAKQPIGQAAEIRDKITTACHIKRCTWYHWLAGRVEIPDMAVDVIDKILGLEIFVKVSEKKLDDANSPQTTSIDARQLQLTNYQFLNK